VDLVPFEIASIESYVAKFLRENGFINFIEENQLHPFQLQVLSRERTFFEKLLSLVRLSYTGQEAIKKKVRHFYDLYKLYNLPDLHTSLLSEASFPLVENVMAGDQANVTFAGEWLTHPLSKCPLFAGIDQFWSAIASTYTSGYLNSPGPQLFHPQNKFRNFCSSCVIFFRNMTRNSRFQVHILLDF